MVAALDRAVHLPRSADRSGPVRSSLKAGIPNRPGVKRLEPLAFGHAAKPAEIGWMATFLASDLSGYTTGSIITIDGGSSSRRSAL